MQRVARRDSAAGIEMWGGVECTVNRVDDRWFNQLERNGHAERTDDIDRCSELGSELRPIARTNTLGRGAMRGFRSFVAQECASLRD